MRALASAMLASAILCTQAPAARSFNLDSDAAALLSSYLRYILVQQAPKQAENLIGNATERVAAQVRAQAKSWTDQRIAEIRGGLEARYGADAKEKFQTFISKFTQMEEQDDPRFLDMMNRALGMSPPAASYNELRGVMAETFLMDDLDAGASLLGEMQTWMDVQAKQEGVPPLGIWMSRDEIGGGGSAPREEQASEPALDPLEAAEGDFGGFTEIPEDEAFNPLDSYASARKAKRDRIAEESKAGMAMVAAERQAWESSYAEKKQAAAEADAAAMKRQAEDLAKVEEEAFQQRQKSWGNRLKKIVASAAGSFAGGVTGGFATRATEEAVNEIWP